MEKEIRNTNGLNIKDDSRTIEGYAVVFNSESNDLGGFTEVIMPSAITDETIANSDIMALLEHNQDRGILARSRNGIGSLRLEIDERGLKYSFEAPNTQLGNEVLEYIKRGDISQSSFAFKVETQEWEKKGGKYLRHIKKIDKLFDVSAVFSPAYSDAYVGLAKRSLKEFKENEEKEDLREYYNNLKNQI